MEVLQAALYEEIGRLKFELDWLKKKLLLSVEARRTMIEVYHPQLSVRRQCELVGLNRSSVYYQPACASPENVQLMRLMDEQYLKTPFFDANFQETHTWANTMGQIGFDLTAPAQVRIDWSHSQVVAGITTSNFTLRGPGGTLLDGISLIECDEGTFPATLTHLS
jgi:hypothetical protein